MLIKCIKIAVIVLVAVAAAHYDDDSDESSESLEYLAPKNCVGGQCHRSPNGKHSLESSEETTKSKQNTQHPNIFELVQLLSLLAKDANDLQNLDRKYHVGNIHRELKREKRQAEFGLNESSSLKTEVTETGLALTGESGTNNVNIANIPEENNSKELAKQTADNPQEKGDNKSVEVNVRHAEADNFQDSNATNIYDSIANDTTAEPVNPNEEISNHSFIIDNNSADALNVSTEPSSGDYYNRRFNVEINNHSYIPSNDSKNDLPPVGQDDFNSTAENIDTIQQLPKVNIPLTRVDLNKIQNALSDDLGVPSRGAKPVANFSLNGPLESGKKNPVVVIVYNCSCGKTDNHTHDNSTELATNDTKVNVEEIPKEVFSSRRSMSDSVPIFKVAESEIKPLVENITPEVQKVNEPIKNNNALLEKELLDKCNSLLSLQLGKTDESNAQTNNAVNPSINEANVDTTQQLFSADNIGTDNDGNTSQDVGFNNPDIVRTYDINSINDSNYKEASVQEAQVDSNSDVQQGDGIISQANSNTDVVDQIANLNTADISQEPPNPQTNDAVATLTNINRRKRSNTKDLVRALIDRNNMYRRKRDLTEILNKILGHLLIFPDNTKRDSNYNYDMVNNFDDVQTNDNTNRRRRSLRNLINKITERNRNLRNKRNIKDINDYVSKHYLNTNFKDTVRKSKRATVVSRSPKYYDYKNKKPKLLDDDDVITNEYDGTVVNFEPINKQDEFLTDNHYYKVDSETDEQNNKFKTLITSISNDDLLSLKPVIFNIYFQLLLRNFEDVHQNDH